MSDINTGSKLFRALVKTKTLDHPTSVKFDPAKWLLEALSGGPLSERDKIILKAALYFGEEVRLLRSSVEKYLVAPYSRESGKRLLASTVNQQFMIMREKVLRANRRFIRNRIETHIEALTQTVVRTVDGQRFNADDHITHLVDAVPHWLYHLWQITPGGAAPRLQDPSVAGLESIRVASMERGLRDLWHSVVWQGHEVCNRNEGVAICSCDRSIDEKWLVWYLRDSSLMAAETLIDASIIMAAGGNLLPVIPVLSRTVISIKRLHGRKRKFVVGRASGHSQRQRSHVSERDTLERLYTGIFIDIPLPYFKSKGIKCRELCHAWWVLTDVAYLLMDEIYKHDANTPQGMNTSALSVTLQEITDLISASLSIEDERARTIIDFFTCDPTETTR